MTVDYKDTLNLPNTAFPMRANLPQNEPHLLAKWQENKIYSDIRKHCQGKKKYILHLGPPYANGDIHIGHALTTILKDIIVKSKTLSGYDAPLVPGWDCHGLPIEINVEKKIGLANVDVPPNQFRDACREYANSQIALQKASFIRLGIFADWDNPYKTMDHRYEAEIIRCVAKVWERGHLQQGAKPVHWCISCGSALAEAEVEYQNKISPAIDVSFNIVDLKNFFKAIAYDPATDFQNVSLIIWTTTPWTLPANQAVTLHPDLEYVLIKANINGVVEVICLLKDLMADCLMRYECTDNEVLTTFKGKQVEGLLLQHPFYDRKVPIVLGEHVTIDAGTGIVHTAPGHGLEDYIIGMQYHLPIDNPVANNGCFYPDLPFVGGLFVFKANDKVIEILREKNRLLHATTLNHSYPHCWRHKTPLIFRATPQWFISMDKEGLRNATLNAIRKVQWVPQWGQSRISLMVEQRPDWCISRQRTWGVPLPLILHKESSLLHPQMGQIIAYVAKLVEENGIEAWHELDIKMLPFSDLENYQKSQDVLDVWFESGVSHTAVLKARDDLQFPADLYLEGSDQHRGWFQSSLLSSVAMYDRAPYEAVLTHGFTVDAQGRKMSKSLGNVVAPDKVVKNLGADVLRLWVASTDYKSEIHVSDEILKRMSDAYRRIRNTMRFLLANLHDFEPVKNVVAENKLLPLDAWIIDCTKRLQDEVIQSYDTFQFHNIYQKIHNFCVVELGSFYLDVIKDRQYTTKTNSVARRSAQTAIYYMVHAITRWLAPILSFTAQEIWQYLPGKKEASVFLTEWFADFPKYDEKSVFNHDYWQQMIAIRNQVNKALEQQRVQGVIGAPLDAEVTLYANDEIKSFLSQLSDELRFVLITSNAIVKPLSEKEKTAVATEIEGLCLKVTPSEYLKCVRCWHHRKEVNQNPQFPEICDRCVTNVDPNSSGEVRHYA